jgi:uncharacterized repeat protein (TIGR01451 family)
MKSLTTHVAFIVSIACVAAGCGGAAEPASRSDAVTSPGPLTLSMAAAGPLVQGTFTPYTVTLTNTTPNTITIISLSADFPDATINQIPAGCVRAPGGQPEFICGIQSIAAGAALVFDTQVRPDIAGTVTFQAVSSGNGANLNFLSDVESVAPAATDVQVTGSSSNGSPPLGSVFTYTLQVKNNGPFATYGGVSFTDILPASLAFLGVSTTTGTCTGGATVSCSLGDLAVGAQAVIRISVRAPSSAQTIVDTASVVIGAQPDRNPANNSVSVTVTAK